MLKNPEYTTCLTVTLQDGSSLHPTQQGTLPLQSTFIRSKWIKNKRKSTLSNHFKRTCWTFRNVQFKIIKNIRGTSKCYCNTDSHAAVLSWKGVGSGILQCVVPCILRSFFLEITIFVTWRSQFYGRGAGSIIHYWKRSWSTIHYSRSKNLLDDYSTSEKILLYM